MQYKIVFLIASSASVIYINASQEPTAKPTEKTATVTHKSKLCSDPTPGACNDEEDEEINALLEGVEIETPEIAEHSAFVAWIIMWRNRIGLRLIENPVGLKMFDFWLATRNWVYGIQE